MEHAFGSSPALTVGMEEELLLVDPRTHALKHHATEIVPRTEVPVGEVKYDVYEALVETASSVCATAGQAAADLAALRQALREAGATLVGCGIHPDGAFGDVEHVDEPRYKTITDSMRGLIRRTPTAALHVHVGMPDPETAVRALNGLREHLPLLQAMAAHSPWWYGRDPQFATARAQMYRAYPRAIIPRAFARWDDYQEVLAAAVAAAEVPDYSYLWWDLRLHPRLGTIEMRAMDAQASLRAVAGLGELVRALVARAAETPQRRSTPQEALTESSFRAGRDGLEATIWDGTRLRPVRELAADALEAARPYAHDLTEAERIVREGNGADRMRAAYADGGMAGVLAHLVAETATPM